MGGLRAALLGVQHGHSMGHLRTLQVLPEVESILLWDESADALAAMRAKQGAKVEGVYTDLDAVLGQSDVLFAIAALPNDVAPDVCTRAVEAGKHVLAEKPMGRTAAEVERVVRAAEKAGVALGMCYQNRYYPCAVEAKRLIAEGYTGPLMSMEARLLTTQVRYRNPAGWLFNKERAGGGMLTWLGCHYIDLLRYVSGDEVVAVSAEMNTMSGEDIDVEDVATVALRFRSGAVGVVHVGYVLPLKGQGHHAGGNDTHIGLTGRTGRLFWEPAARPPRLYAESREPAWASSPVRQFEFQLSQSEAYGGSYGEAFMRDFVRACRGEGEPPASGRDGLMVARIVEAAYEANETGRRVEVAR